MQTDKTIRNPYYEMPYDDTFADETVEAGSEPGTGTDDGADLFFVLPYLQMRSSARG